MAHPGGRPTKYNPEFHPKLAESLAANGLVNDQIAEKLEIDRATLYRWIDKYPEFCDALKNGKKNIDELVEESLFKSAIGYEVEETEIIARKDGDDTRPIRIKKKKKHIQPNPTAQIFWLKNRKPEEWRDKKDVHITEDAGEGIMAAFEKRKKLLEGADQDGDETT